MNVSEAAHHAWEVAYNQLELQLDRGSFDTWLRGAALLRVEGGPSAASHHGRPTLFPLDDEADSTPTVFIIGVRNTYARDMLQHRLYRNVWRVVSDVWGKPIELRFEVHQPAVRQTTDSSADMPLFRLLAEQEANNALRDTGYSGGTADPGTLGGLYDNGSLSDRVRRPERPSLPESELNPKFTFDRYIVSAANHMAYEAARAVSEHPGRYYNPFFVYGGVGQGKTHLLHAIAHVCQSKGMRVIYISSEAFMNDLIDAIRHKTTPMFREKYRSADVLLVDDVQFISGKESTQEEFFHTFNALYTFNKQIVLASDRPPHELDTLEDRLRSRFEGGLVVDIPPLEFETRIAILQMWAQERGVNLPMSVLERVANRSRSSVRELEGVFNQLIAKAQFAGQPFTLDSAEHILQRFDSPRYHGRPPATTLDEVIAAIAQYYHMEPRELTGKARAQRVNNVRQVAMFLARELTTASLNQIGEAFGGRSHTTVLHGCNKMVEMMELDSMLCDQVAELRELLRKC